MSKIDDIKNKQIVVTDGAMGTYFSIKTGIENDIPERYNTIMPEVIGKIHSEYLDAGAEIIRTNTFSANKIVMKSEKAVEESIRKAVSTAKTAIGARDAIWAADIGPIPNTLDGITYSNEEILVEYKRIAGIFADEGAELFIFETFSSIDFIEEISKYIKSLNNNIYIIVQFAVMYNGHTRRGKSIKRIAEAAEKITSVDAFGFNCGTGPTHMMQNLKAINFGGKMVSALPNAGFPEIINERTVYSQSSKYFADTMGRILELGATVIGGCCGTTPEHIRELAIRYKGIKGVENVKRSEAVEKEKEISENSFIDKLNRGKFIIAVELDPPYDYDIKKMVLAANVIKNNGGDIITISDSPLGKVRANPISVASKIKREAGIEVMPHLCCRDRNMIAIKSDVMGGYIEGINNILAVTGDPIPIVEKNEVKSVFNMNSVTLMEIIDEMNNEKFSHNKIGIAGALNLNVLNIEPELSKMSRKIEAGAKLFLTQPIFDTETAGRLKHIKEKYNVKILGGIMPLVSYRNAVFLNSEIPGIKINPKYIEMFTPDMPRDEAEQKGIAIAEELCGAIRPYVDGFYFIAPFNRAEMIAKIIKSACREV